MQFKIDIRLRDGGLTDRTMTANIELAEAGYRELLRRDDLVGKPCAARLWSSIARKSIYFSCFDRDFGDGRIHPDAPLDLSRTDDGTSIATKWRPIQRLDYDGLPFPELLRAWGTKHDWSNAEMARQLRVPYQTFRKWIEETRDCSHDESMRLLMRLIDDRA